MSLHSLEELQARFARACTFKQPVDRDRITAALLAWFADISSLKITVRFVEDDASAARAAWAAGAARAAWAAWDASDASAARAARAARAANAAWDASAASAAWDAWAARAASAASAARAASAAWDARAAWAAWDASWMAALAIGATAREDEKTAGRWLHIMEALEAGAWIFWITNTEIVVSTVPQAVLVDDRRRLHSDDGPAFSWLGVDDYWHHGVLMPTDEAKYHSRITISRIDHESNAEVRRVLLGWFGIERYMRESGASLVHADLDALGNPRRLLERAMASDETVVMVEVSDSTPQANGTHKTYMLRVDPKAYDGRAGRECHAAIASTWRKKANHQQLFFAKPEDYRPLVET